MITVNAMGEQCPIPVIKTKKAISTLTAAETLEVLVDNDTAVQNVTKYATSIGAKVSTEAKSESEFILTVDVDAASIAQANGATEEAPAATGDTIVVVSSATMGTGNDELGKVLIKGFVFALTQLDELPKALVFYNGGVTLTSEGSEVLEDLKKLEAEGVEIVSCGTCLDYYQLKEKLAIGSITNMYDIVQRQANAARIIRP